MFVFEQKPSDLCDALVWVMFIYFQTAKIQNKQTLLCSVRYEKTQCVLASEVPPPVVPQMPTPPPSPLPILKPTHGGTKKVKCEWSGAGDLSESFHERGQSLTSLPPDPLYPATSKHSMRLLSEAAKGGGWRALLLLTGGPCVWQRPFTIQ